jgi:hypothetical protein
MSTPHKATPDQWAYAADRVGQKAYACLLELRDRLEALESAQYTHVEAKAAEAGARCAVEQIRSKPGSWQSLKVDTEITYGDAHAAAKQILRAPMVVEGTFEHGGETYRFKAKPERETAMDEPREASLLDRVTWLIAKRFSESSPGTDCTPFGRDVIREVAAALIDWWDSDEVARTGWEAAKWLEQEANR